MCDVIAERLEWMMFEKQIEHIEALQNELFIDEFYRTGDWLPESLFPDEFLWFNLEMFQFYQLRGFVCRANGDFMREAISAVLMFRGMNG